MKLSVIMPAYNEQATLEQATMDVRAALRELGREFEILIVDDGSSDRTAEIAADLERRCREVRSIRHPRNLGSGHAILTGVRNSRNDVICFHAADNQLKGTESRRTFSLFPGSPEHDQHLKDAQPS